jgi:hypothetical protein
VPGAFSELFLTNCVFEINLTLFVRRAHLSAADGRPGRGRATAGVPEGGEPLSGHRAGRTLLVCPVESIEESTRGREPR